MYTVANKKTDRRVFTDGQNAALHVVLRDLQQRRHYSGVALAQLLGIEQQNASRLLKSADEGFSYRSATRLVRLAGFAGVDTFFRARGVALPEEIPHQKSA